uniref:Uncharacterized protein n=1 Tax=Oryza sativa subsp. japonica TaxID=39947 RepID=Q33BK7_ORYSJ|nr:hypothetical protein LOC_Os10g01030 [Oryza sativa Japonica Group]
MTSHDDDETRDPQTSRGPEDEVVGIGAEPPTTIIPHCLRLHQEAILAVHENVVHILLWIPYKWSRYHYDWSSIDNVAILVPQLPLVEVRLRLVFSQQRSNPRTTTSNGRGRSDLSYLHFKWSSYDYNWSSASDVAILPLPMRFVVHNYTVGLCPVWWSSDHLRQIYRSITTITPIDPLRRSDKPPRDLREFQLGTPIVDKVLSDSESRTTMKQDGRLSRMIHTFSVNIRT